MSSKEKRPVKETKTTERAFNWDTWLNRLQKVSSILLLGLAIWLAFFSPFSKVLETQLRANLANAELGLTEIRQQKTKLEAELENTELSLTEIQLEKIALQKEKSRLNEEIVKTKADLKEIQLSKNSYLTGLKDDYFREYFKEAQGRINGLKSWAQFVENSETFLNLATKYTFEGDSITLNLSPKMTENEIREEADRIRKAREAALDEIKRVSGFSSRLLLRFQMVKYELEEEGLDKEEIIKKFREQLINSYWVKPFNGLQLFNEIKGEKYLGNLQPKDTENLFNLIDSFIKEKIIPL